MKTSLKHPTGSVAFTIIWIGQAISLLGSSMTLFAITIWAWQKTEQATALALVSACAYVPSLVISPLAGALIDRWNRKLVMMMSDFGAATATLVVLMLHFAGLLQVWHLYVMAAFAGLFNAFQIPAYLAAVTLMLHKEQYTRAEGLMGFAQAAAGILAPAFAAALLAPIGINGIMLIDLGTFLVAFVTLLWVHVPQPEVSQAGQRGRGSLWQESLYGLRYIWERPSLRMLMLVFLSANLFENLGVTLFSPMILARSNNSEAVLGSVQSIGALGGMAGGILMTVWGGPKRKMYGIFAGWMCAYSLGLILMGFGASARFWMLASFLFYFFGLVADSCSQAFWQVKVAPDVQGRVFATKLLVIQIPIPIAMLLAGWLADDIFEPGMRAGGRLASLFPALAGQGAGSGMALLLIFSGIFGLIVMAFGYMISSVRKAEDLLPDYDAITPEPTAVSG